MDSEVFVERSVLTVSSKKTIRWLEIPIEKFNDAVPHFVEVLLNQTNSVLKFKKLNQLSEAQRLYNCASRTASQLQSLLTEIDNLKSQVIEGDLVKFDKLIFNSKQSAIKAIQNFQDISLEPDLVKKSYIEAHDPFINTDDKYQQLQVVANLKEDLTDHEIKAALLEKLEDDVQNIHGIYQELQQITHMQGESVDKVEEIVETAHYNVTKGEEMLCAAARIKNGMYPLMGALIGSFLGGPVGLLAGFKLGGLSAVGFGVLGFTGGKMLKNTNELTTHEADSHRKELSQNS